MNDSNEGRAYLYEGDDDAQVFKHYLEKCDGDPMRAFNAYKENYFDPVIRDLQQRKAEAEAKLRNRNARSADEFSEEVNHFIDFIKKLDLNVDPTFEAYKNYCARQKIEPRYAKTKFYEVLDPSIKRILLSELSSLPKNFELAQAQAICKDWRIPQKHMDDLLQDEDYFVKLPLTAEELTDLKVTSDVYMRFF